MSESEQFDDVENFLDPRDNEMKRLVLELAETNPEIKITDPDPIFAYLRLPDPKSDVCMTLSLISSKKNPTQNKDERCENYLIRYWTMPSTEAALEMVQTQMQTEIDALEYIRLNINTSNEGDTGDNAYKSRNIPVPLVLQYDAKGRKITLPASSTVRAQCTKHSEYGPYLLMKIESDSSLLLPLEEAATAAGIQALWDPEEEKLGDQPKEELKKMAEKLAEYQFKLFEAASSSMTLGLGTIRKIQNDTSTGSAVGEPNWKFGEAENVWQWYGERLKRITTHLTENVRKLEGREIPEAMVDDVPELDNDSSSENNSHSSVSPESEEMDVDSGSDEYDATWRDLEEVKARTATLIGFTKELSEILSEVSTLAGSFGGVGRGEPTDIDFGHFSRTFLQPSCEFNDQSILVDEHYTIHAIVDWVGAGMVPAWRIGLAPRIFRGPTIHSEHVKDYDGCEGVVGLTEASFAMEHRRYQLRKVYRRAMKKLFEERQQSEVWYRNCGDLDRHERHRGSSSTIDVDIWETMLARDFDILLMALEGPNDNPDGYLRGLCCEEDEGYRKHVSEWLEVFQGYITSALESRTAEEAQRSSLQIQKPNSKYAPFSTRLFFRAEEESYRIRKIDITGLDNREGLYDREDSEEREELQARAERDMETKYEDSDLEETRIDRTDAEMEDSNPDAEMVHSDVEMQDTSH